MAVQVFTRYQGKIIALLAKVGDEVEKRQTLFTVDSPDLLAADSTLIAAAGVLDLTSRNLVRLKMLYAAEQRMRPMLMTALSACIGLLPAAVSSGVSSQVQRPLAAVVVGGMLVGPVIMLVVAPALQILFMGRGIKRETVHQAQDLSPAE
jgi:hypothetical protein